MIVLSPGTKLCKAGRFDTARPLVNRLWTAAIFDDGIIDVGIANTEGVVTEEMREPGWIDDGMIVERAGLMLILVGRRLIELRAGIILCRAGTFD